MDPMSKLEVTEHVLWVIMKKQYILNAGLKTFWKDVKAIVKKELSQLNDMNTFTMLDGSHLSKQFKTDSIKSLMSMTKKETSESIAEHALMAVVSVENSKNKMQYQ